MGGTAVQLLPSPWACALDRLVESVQWELLLASPFISRGAAARVLKGLARRCGGSVRVHIVTDLAVGSLLEGSLEPMALLDVLDAIPSSVVSIAPRLHAKTYVADTSCAIITSANLTDGGLCANREYGVLLQAPRQVSEVKRHILAYASLGNRVSRPRLEVLAEATSRVRSSRESLLRSARRALREQFDARVEEAATEILRTRVEGKSTHAIFRDTVLYLLQHHGPLTTKALQPLVKATHVDLCDDSVDRVIAGVHFGKRWKHYVRNAQQHLKRSGKVAFSQGIWRAL